MKKNTDEDVELAPEETPNLIGHDFQREDLNELRDAVNYLLSK